MTTPDPTPDLAAAVARLREHAETCERTDTGDGWMETPIEAARQMGADLRVVLGVADAASDEGVWVDSGVLNDVREALAREWAPEDDEADDLRDRLAQAAVTAVGKTLLRDVREWEARADRLAQPQDGRIPGQNALIINALYQCVRDVRGVLTGERRPQHADDLLDEAWALLASGTGDFAWRSARDEWGDRYGLNEPPHGGPNRAKAVYAARARRGDS